MSAACCDELMTIAVAPHQVTLIKNYFEDFLNLKCRFMVQETLFSCLICLKLLELVQFNDYFMCFVLIF